MAAMIEPAPAKLNLALHVRARRPDGYHELETIFAFVRDGDILTVEPAPQDRFQLTGPMAQALKDDPDNLVTRARDLFRTKVMQVPPLEVTLDKRLPVASGLGGGSADAAAMLRVMARMTRTALDDPRLFECADALGSDVPACLLGKTSIGSGRGEALSEVALDRKWPVLLVNPGVAVATGPVFKGWDQVDRGALATEAPVIEAAMSGRNDLEPSAIAIAPAIKDALDLLKAQSGVYLARMSGSGATCFAMFEAEADCAAAEAAINAAKPDWWCLKTELV